MLIVSFSIAVEEDHAHEMQKTLMDNFGVEITSEVKYKEKLCFSEPIARVYFECFAPKYRMQAITDYLDTQYTGTAILSY